MFKSVVKTCALTLFAAYAWLRIRFSRKPRLLILTYHRVLPSDHPQRAVEQPGMVISPEALNRHIKLVKKLGAELVHLNHWLALNKQGQTLPRLAVAFTFDDGWRDNFQHAYPELKAQDAPATIFLVTRMLGTDQTFWPEQILNLLSTNVITAQDSAFDWLRPYLPRKQGPFSLLESDQVINRLKSLDDVTILHQLECLYAAHPQWSPTQASRVILDEPELQQMSRDGLVRYGAHTRHHYRLDRLKDEGTLRDEIVGCLDDMQFLGNAFVSIFCYPNGDITGKGERLVSDHYKAACTTKTGWNRAGCNPYDLHRFNLHDGNSYNGLTLLATIGRGLL